MANNSPTPICLPSSLQNRCSVGLERMTRCGGSNAYIGLFREYREHENPCYSAQNPFIPGESTVMMLWHGCATVTLGQSVTRQSKEWGDIETHTRQMQLIGQGVKVETGIWAYVRIGEDLIGGRIDTVGRDSPPFINLTLNTAKPVPFPPEAVGAGSWPRGPQV
jgi:hypothetical protein